MSGVHARGVMKPLLRGVLTSHVDWDMLDVTTGRGTPRSCWLVPEILATARAGAAARELTNIDFVQGDGDALLFAGSSFAAPSLAHPARFVAEVRRGALATLTTSWTTMRRRS